MQEIAKLFSRALEDDKVTSVHVSLLTAIVYAWLCQSRANPFRISRRMLMSLAKIASPTTFHKLITELVEHQYIRYQPSFNPSVQTTIEIIAET